jgi:mannose-6-phosphate isomerase-like protein (cupin superfamily)
VTLAASKYNGRSVTVASLVAATTIRAIADGADVVCASAAAARAAVPKSANPIVLKRIVISLVKSSRGTSGEGLFIAGGKAASLKAGSAMPSNPPHHRSGAALYYVISGTGANTVGGKTEARGPGSLIYEPFGLVHQWGNPGNEPLTLLAFNINPDGVAAVLPGAPVNTQ